MDNPRAPVYFHKAYQKKKLLYCPKIVIKVILSDTYTRLASAFISQKDFYYVHDHTDAFSLFLLQ